MVEGSSLERGERRGGKEREEGEGERRGGKERGKGEGERREGNTCTNLK